jgi:hypothetical protein
VRFHCRWGFRRRGWSSFRAWIASFGPFLHGSRRRGLFRRGASILRLIWGCGIGHGYGCERIRFGVGVDGVNWMFSYADGDPDGAVGERCL